jgi:serine/threonine-protein kinase
LFEAWDTKLHRLVVIKQLPSLGDHLDSVLGQARKAAALSHAAFVKIHALEESDDSVYIVMEAVQGQGLADWILEHQGQENLALIHIKQIAAALSEAHAAGLVHGDLTPANLIIDTAGRVRILNLGFVTHFNPHAVTNVADIDPRGSIAYLAPERFVEAAPTSTSDVFALGTILYQMLLGHQPYVHLQGVALVAAQAQAASMHWTWSDNLSAEVHSLVLGMTTFDSAQRLSLRQVQEECKKLTVSEANSASASDLNIKVVQAQLASAARRRRYLLSIACLILLSLGAIAIWPVKPNWPHIVKMFKPFSESRELEQGMQALAKYDKPGMLDKATTHFNSVLERNSNSAHAVAGLSIVYNYRFRSSSRDDVWREKALASYQRALQLNPDLALAQVAYALSLDPHQQFDLAMSAVARAKKMEPNSLLVWQTELRIFLMARKYDDAIRTADAALKLFPNDWLILNLKGIVYLNQAQFTIAEQLFRTNILHNPDVVLSYNFLNNALEAQGRTDEALQVLQQGLQIRPDAILYKSLGQIKYHRGEFVSAVNALEKAVEANPKDFDNWASLADALNQIGSRADEARLAYEKARELLEISIGRRPNDGWFIAHLATFEASLGHQAKAQSLIERALELNPGNPNVHFLAARVFEQIGKRGNALLAIQKSKALGITDAQINAEPYFVKLRKDPQYEDLKSAQK